MKKRRKTSTRRSRSPVRYGLELAILCVLLMAAAYVGNVNRPSSPTTTQKQTSAEKANAPAQKQTASSAEKKTATKKSDARTETKAEASSVADARQYRLVRAADGDSFTLKDDRNQNVNVRLYGVDAPESSQRFGKQSREHLLQMLKGRTLRLKTLYRDNYKRAVAIVYLTENGAIDERSVNQRQVQAGMAWVYDYFCTSDICNTWKLEEAMAQKQKIGLWKDSNPTPPWQWRRANPRR